ncbi:MAG: mechanosensitive ion channel family protein [Candidatus Eisenbacteria bacterium]|nr:mechanosensitive ion channel family protein [Candidatus Eisenbacteria bacterium]
MSLPAVTMARRYIPETEKLVDMGVRLALTLVAAFLLQQLAFLLVGRLERWVERAGSGTPHAVQRARTLGQIARSLASVVVWAGAAVHALDVFGWDVRPLLAGAGILGVALGFGAQTLVRDVIAGFFILAENQFAVGDLIEVGGTAATVEEVTLRFTRLRDFNGYVHYVPNGEMRIVSNRSRGWNRLAVDVPVGADEDLERAIGVCRTVVDEMNADPAWRQRLLDPVEMCGVESLVGDEVHLRMVLRARPGAAAPETARELRRRCHRALAAAEVRTRTSREIAITPIAPRDIPAPTAGARPES